MNFYNFQGTHPSLWFNKKGQLEAIAGKICLFCKSALRPTLVGMMCENPGCNTYMQPSHRWQNVYYDIKKHEQEAKE